MEVDLKKISKDIFFYIGLIIFTNLCITILIACSLYANLEENDKNVAMLISMCFSIVSICLTMGIIKNTNNPRYYQTYVT